jgi:hypothetical protein
MSYEQKPNTGVLFKAEKKSDKHPDYTGTLKMEDGEYLLSAWIKEGKRGKFFSLSLKKKDATASKTSSNDNDLPF